jgi:hypothetical protein
MAGLESLEKRSTRIRLVVIRPLRGVAGSPSGYPGGLVRYGANAAVVDARTEKAFEFAIEVTRQLLTLSAAILAITITLARDITTGDFNLLAVATFLVSIVCGILALYALVIELSPGGRSQVRPPSLAASGVRAASFTQIGTFLVGTAFLVAFGWSAL